MNATDATSSIDDVIRMLGGSPGSEEYTDEATEFLRWAGSVPTDPDAFDVCYFEFRASLRLQEHADCLLNWYHEATTRPGDPLDSDELAGLHLNRSIVIAGSIDWTIAIQSALVSGDIDAAVTLGLFIIPDHYPDHDDLHPVAGCIETP